jgi:hypothetical protein
MYIYVVKFHDKFRKDMAVITFQQTRDKYPTTLPQEL